MSMDDHWPEGSIAEGVRSGGHISAKTHGHLEALSSCRLFASGSKGKKRKTVARWLFTGRNSA
jgi:hypothetical protein